MNGGLFASFLVAALVIQIAPGPGMLFIVANGVAGGRLAGVAAACGAATAMLVHTGCVAFGLAALLRAAPTALTAIRIAGACYLGWLAVQAFRSPAQDQNAGITASSTFRSLFLRGALNNLGNPKIILFYLVFLPQFVDPLLGHMTAQLLALGSTLLLIGLAIDVAIGMLTGQVGTLLRGRPSIGYWMNRVAGTVYAGLAARLVTNN